MSISKQKENCAPVFVEIYLLGAEMPGQIGEVITRRKYSFLLDIVSVQWGWKWGGEVFFSFLVMPSLASLTR